MKKYLFVLSIAVLVSSSISFAQTGSTVSKSTKMEASSNQNDFAKMIIALEREGWEACKRHDTLSFASLCLKDQYEIWGDGQLLTTKEVISQIRDTEILEYTMEDIRVFNPNDQTAIVRYKIFAKTSYKGVVIPAEWMIASSVWVKMGQTWKFAMYQETLLPK